MSETTAMRTVMVCGNPNSGKTTLFNGLTGSNQRVGNWPGVTVERKEGTMMVESPSLGMVTGTGAPSRTPASATVVHQGRAGHSVQVVDLPGIYSLSAVSEDEVVARDALLKRDFDLVVNIVDAANLERNLYLTLQLLEMGLPVLVVLNMLDLAEARGITVDPEHLALHLGCPVIAVSSTTRHGISSARREIVAALDTVIEPSLHLSFPTPLQEQLDRWTGLISSEPALASIDARYLALRLIEGDPWVESQVYPTGVISLEDCLAARESLRRQLHQDLDIVVAEARYGFIHGVSRDVMVRRPTRESVTEKIDQVVMNRFLGFPVFFAVMYLVFAATISLGGAFIDFFDILGGTFVVGGLRALFSQIGSPEWLTVIVADGIGSGIQTVATFVPIIFMMFLMLSLLEDSGYMARAAFVMDRLMRWVGLPGKSFVPLLVGFGCTVPAISASRTLDSRKDRYMTVFMAPFMSCGARLPVYALFSAALFPHRAGVVVFALYVTGLVLAILTGLLLKHTLFRGEYSHFVMELPPYHVPRPFAVLRLAGQRLKVFIVRAGVTITIVVTVLAVLNTVGTDGSFGHDDSPDSILSEIGRGLTPIFTPMGIQQDNWPATVGLFTGLFAKEAIVGTLGSLYSQDVSGDDQEDDQLDLLGGLLEAVGTIPENLGALVGISPDDDDQEEMDGGVFGRMRSRFNPAGGFAYLLFVLIYFPCIAALGAAIQEMGVGYGALLAGYLTVLAWSVAVIFYQVATGPSVPVLALAAGLLVAMGLLFRLLPGLRGNDR